MQCKDIDEKPILEWLAENQPGISFEGFDNYIGLAFDNLPRKVMMAKLKKMIACGSIRGCACGCRGDFELSGSQGE